jgi:hypothetical protein
MTAQILKLAPLPGVDAAAFEQMLKDKILPDISILRRNVAGTSHRLFQPDAGGPNSPSFVWLMFTQMVGPTPETAGEGPVILCETLLPVDQIARDLAGLATVTTLQEI